MKALFVTTDLIGSKLIRFGTGENVSHCAFKFDSDDLVYHATGDSIHRTPTKEFNAHYRILDVINILCTPEEEQKTRDLFVSSIGYQKYDWKLMAYFAFDRFRVKFFGAKPMKINPWDEADNTDCVEVAYILDECFFKATHKRLLPSDINLGVTTPGQLRTVLKERRV